MKKKKREKFWFENAEENKADSFSLDRNINKLMKQMISPMRLRIRMPEMRRLENRRLPIDISERPDKLLLRADLPGFKKEDIKLKVTPRTIDITAQKKVDKVNQRENFFRRERSSGSIRRAFRLPFEIKPEFVKAKMENGILKIEMPKLNIRKKKEKEVKIK